MVLFLEPRLSFSLGPRKGAAVDLFSGLATLRGAFGIVLFVVVALGAIFACVTLITARRVYGQIGRGRLSINDDLTRSEPDQHDAEIRQMLRARNERRQRRS